MKKIFLLLLTVLFAAISHAQVTGAKTIGVDYPTIAAAVTDLNTVGVGAGGATINVPAGYTETAPAGGYLLGTTLLNASLSAGNPLVFQKSGAGVNPLITAPAGTSTTVDGIFKIAGSDYVTITSIDLTDPNTGTPATMEWGYAMVNLNGAAPFDGCQFVTIQNCTITLNRINPNASFGIYSGHVTATSTTALTITAVGDLHSNNKIYGNTISNATFGIFLAGFAAATPFTLYDQNNDVGGTSAATGNNISNIGNLTGFNSFGIYLANHNGANASYNTINYFQGFGGTAVAYGIYFFGTTSNATANNNTISIGQAAGSGVVAGVYGQNTGSLVATNNSISFADAGGSGSHYGIFSASATTANISSNTFTASNTGPVTGVYGFVYDGSTGTGETFTNNTFNNINISTTGTTYLIYASNSTPNQTVTGNVTTGTINRTGATGTMYCYYNFGSPGSGTANISGNNFSNITLTGTTAFYGIYQATGTGQIENVNNNTVNNITTGTGTLIGIHHNYGAIGSTANGNTVSNINGTGTITGIQLGNATASLGLTVSNNVVHTLRTTGASTVSGMIYTSGANSSIFKNKIYNLEANSATGIANGLTIAGGVTVNVYNNLIGDLRAPSTSSATDAVRGINISAATASSTRNLYYNTIYLNAASTGANFGASGVFHTASTTATSASLTMQNNIIYNNSFASGSGFVTAFRRSGGAGNFLNNYNTASNNNLFFAGAPSPSQLIYYDETSSAQTLAAYKTGVFLAGTIAPRDAASVTELSTPFLSTVGSNANFLHISTTIPTVVESAGMNVPAVTDDYDGNARNATTPDIGADEFAGLVVTACAGTPVAGSITGSNNICQGQFALLTLSGYSTNSGISIQWQSSAVAGGPYSPIAGAVGASYNTGVIPTGTTIYYVVTVTCSNGGGNATTAEFAVTSNAAPTVTVNPPAPAICTGGAGVSLTASGALTYTWSPATGLSGTTGATVTANPAATTTYTVTGTNAAGCISTANVTVTVNQTPIITTSATPAIVCVGANSQLNSTVNLGSPANSYTLTGFTGQTYTTLTGGGITIINTAAQLTAGMGSGSQDDGGVVITLPFTFTYMGNTFTQMSMCTNGWVGAGNQGTIDAVSMRTQGNLFTSTIPNNTIAAWFKDMGANFPLGTGSMRHGLIGTDVYAFQWDNANGSGFGDGSAILISFQVNIYGPASATPGRIEVIYGPTVGALVFPSSLGIEDAIGGANHFINSLNGSGTLTTTSASWPGNGNGYRFDPVVPTYSWSPATFLSSTTIANPVATAVTATTTYTLTVTSPNGCSSTSNVTVTIDPAPFNVTGGGSFCSGGVGVPVGLSGSQVNVNYQLVLNGTTNVGAPVPGTGAVISFGNQTAVGTYTVVATNTVTLCTGNMTGSAVVSLNPVAIISGVITEPTTCVSTDGAITLTLGGAPGPYTFAWTGTGVNPTSQNQTNLLVGLYNVTVTAGNGCTSSASFGLNGPGGCTICPTVPTLTTNPANAVCLNSNVTLTASGLTSMGVTYGITFKHSTVALVDPYVGGTVIATVPNGGLTSGGTVAATTTTFAATGTYFIYAILSPSPIDPLCRPSAVVNLDVNPIPTVNAVTNLTACAGATVTQVFSGAVPGTVFNWTNSNTAIGLGASGTGNLSFTATNAGAAPIVGTITVTPTYTNGGTTCTGTATSFTITINPNPTVNPIPNQSLCQGLPTAPVNFTGTPAGVVYQWTNSNTQIGLAAAGTGNIASFIATNPTAAPITGTITVTPVTGLNGPVTTTFNYTGAMQTFTVPAGITSVNIRAWGAQGNSNALGVVGGLGGYAEGTLAVTPGQTLFVYAGGGAATTINGGFNGGGAGGINSGCASAQGGGGGGASDVRLVNTLAGRILVAAGGGGAGANRVAGCGRGTGGGGGGGYYGGGGGAGWPGIPPGGPVPTGGTQTAGGAGGVTTFTPGPTNGFPGALGVGGAGGTEIGSAQGGSATGESGGVGGGLIGANGLYNPTNNWCGQSGAGGSSYIGGVTAGLTTSGLRTGNGMVTIAYTPPSATTCFGAPRTFTITVNPNPSLVIVADPGSVLCQGDPALLTVRVGTSSPIGVLYNQAGVAGNGSPSQVFEPANAAFTSQSADDFTVPAGTVWTVTRVTADGIGAGVPTSVNVFFYNNPASNLPGTVVATYLNLLTFVRTGGNYNVTLPAGLVLGAGTYWVSVQVNMSFATGGQWFWGNFGTTNIGNQYAWQNPGGGFGTPCTSWGYGATGCAVGGGVNRNNIFSIVGSSLADGGPLPGGYTFLWSPAAGLSSTTTNPVAASPATTTTYTVNVNTAQGCTNQASILMTVNLRPTITSQPASRTNCVGSTATFTVTGTGTNLAYQWQVSTTGPGGPWSNLLNAAPYFGVNTATLTINPVAITMNNNQYRCVLTGICAPVGTANISNPAIFTVNPLPAVTVTPGSGCGGVAGSFGTLLTASGADTYTWAPLTGLYTNAIATLPYTGTQTATVYAAPTAFTVYTVTGTFTNTTGCSSTATALINYTPPAPTVTPSAVAMCLGDAAVRLISASSSAATANFASGPISVIVPDASPAGNTSNITVSGIPAGCNISAMSVTWNMTHTWDGDMVFAIRSPNGQILNLDYLLSITGGTGATTGFVNTTVSSTGTAALSSGANPYTGTFRADAVITNINAGDGGPTGYTPTTTTWAPLYANPNGVWTLAMKDGFGGDIGTLTSWSINFTYVCGVPTTAATWSPIAGLFNDALASIPYAGTARDTVWTRPTPSGVYPYTATVQSLPVPPLVFSNPAPIIINDATTANPYPANLVVSGLPTSGVAVRNVTLANMNHTWTSDVDIMLQHPNGTQNVILLSDFGGANDLSNTTLIFDDAAAATVTNANPIPSGTYRPTNVGTPDNFPAPGPGSITQATPTLATFTGNMNGTWKLFVLDQVGGDVGNINGGFSIGFTLTAAACTSPARTVVVTVNQPTTITTQPVSQTVCTDKVATFSVVAAGSGPFSYQWQVSTNNGNTYNNVANGGVYAGATTATLTITAPPVSMSTYQYRCVITGAAPCAAATSFQAMLTVNPLPTVVITASPYTSLFPGLITTLSSTVTPNAASTYTWLRNGSPVAGATTRTLSVDVDGMGDYTLRVTDVNGCTNTSNMITIKDSATGKCFIYPNPSSGQFQVRYYSVANNVLPRSLTVYDAKGDRVITQYFTVGRPYDRMDVDMRKYGKGLYWVEVGDVNGNRITMCRVVIQ